MVKLKGPGLALSAEGTLAELLTFSSSKGTPYLKQKSKPSQPRTKPQVSLRAAMKFLSQTWPNIGATAQLTWATLAQQTNISPYNAFIAYNLERHRNQQGLTQFHPATETGSFGSPTTWTVTGHVRRIRHVFDFGSINQQWAILPCWVTASGVVPTWQDVIQIVYTPWNGTFTWDWYPLAAGTYWFGHFRTTDTGKFFTFSGWRSGVVTD